MRILAVNATARSKGAPDIPTAIEAGLPGMVAGNLNGLFAPANVPKAIIEQIAEATRAFITEELARWTPIMKATGFKME